MTEPYLRYLRSLSPSFFSPFFHQDSHSAVCAVLKPTRRHDNMTLSHRSSGPHASSSIHHTNALSSSSSSKRWDQVLILGLRKSGKSSSFQVVYESLNPEDALQEGVTQTHKSEPYDVDAFHRMRIWDGTSNFSKGSTSAAGTGQQDQSNSKHCEEIGNAKGQAAFGTAGQLYWTECSAVIFIVDSQGEYFEAIERLNDVILSGYSYNPLIHFHVFVHKADGHSNDYRYDTLQDIQSRVADNLSDASQSFIFASTAQDILAEAAAAQDAELNLIEANGGQDSNSNNNANMAYSSSFRGGTAQQSNFTSAGLPSGIGPDLERDVRLSFHVTSILNCSINIAWSRVQIDLMNVEVSKTLESICNGLCNVSVNMS
jgi:Ras-related GTP-binding protein C/D